MMVTQALYDSDGKLVGDPMENAYNMNSYSLEKEVANVSEIVYNISGAGQAAQTALKTCRNT